jgi:broad specificity phosphatase PhoE
MAVVRYLTHPQVVIDPLVPVPDWGLSDVGRARTEVLARSGKLAGTVLIVSSAETKATETAAILAPALKAPVLVCERMHENDRSATGFLAPDAFEEAANWFFSHPSESFRGWERALDAQTRIVKEVDDALAEAPSGDVLLVGHGGVGTLLLCALAGLPIARAHDQLPGGGCIFTFDRASRIVHHRWQTIEAFAGA